MIIYQHNLDGVTVENLRGFWQGWPAYPTPEEHLAILRGSEEIVLAIDPDVARRVAGFITAIGDGVFSAYVPLLEVVPEYRHRGIGSELVRRLFDRLRDRYMLDLVCDEELVSFYDSFGMRPHRAMILRRGEVLAKRDSTR